jgi:hypothetical protein
MLCRIGVILVTPLHISKRLVTALDRHHNIEAAEVPQALSGARRLLASRRNGCCERKGSV